MLRNGLAALTCVCGILLLTALPACTMNGGPPDDNANDNSGGDNANDNTGGDNGNDNTGDDRGFAEGVLAALGEVRPNATADERAQFERGKAVSMRRFDLGDGLGPDLNVTFCMACHERPVLGGGAGLYRNFFITGLINDDGEFELGATGGVLRMFHFGSDGLPARPAVAPAVTIFAQRNPIPLFGTGLILEVSDSEILRNSDPNDVDGDGISGRPNIVDGVIARLGRKAQTIDLEGFIRGPLLNHLGITTDPLTDEQRLALPFLREGALPAARGKDDRQAQLVIGDDERLVDADGATDPELSRDDLFDLVAFCLLLAGPEPEPLNDQTRRGEAHFESIGCAKCHVPTLSGPRGAIPLYSDLLLHDMGEALADGIQQGLAEASEFRTQPLWGIASVGPYLHDGRADTLEAAILAHGGEGQRARDAFAALSDDSKDDVIAFLESLGGRELKGSGVAASNETPAAVGEYGGPVRALSGDDEAKFLRGREVFDRRFGFDAGVGGVAGRDGFARFNGDSCRACHIDPTIGGAGPRGVNVMRHGIFNGQGAFEVATDVPTTILHKEIVIGAGPILPDENVNVFEHRQTPPLFGMGLIDAIDDVDILANADPDDADADGVSGRAHVTSDGRLGRLGWKAQIPSVEEFVRDAMASEMGITLPMQDELSFGLTGDADGVADPELELDAVEDLTFFIEMLAAPPRQPTATSAEATRGLALFESVGCATCHVPVLPATFEGQRVDVPLYSDLLLHDAMGEGGVGIEDDDATMTEFRTPPLWGLSQTAPYLHDGSADTIEEAILGHRGEAASVRRAFRDLSDADKADLLAFLASL